MPEWDNPHWNRLGKRKFSQEEIGDELVKLLVFPEAATPGKLPAIEGKHPPTIDQRVKFIIDGLLDGTWIVGKSELEHADKWGVQFIQVQRAREQAARFLRIFAGNEEDILNRILIQVERGIRMCEDAKGHLMGSGGVEEFSKPDLRERREHMKFFVELLGLMPKEREPPDSGAEENVSLDELKRVLDPIGYEIVRKHLEVGESEPGSDRAESDDSDGQREAETPARKRRARSPNVPKRGRVVEPAGAEPDAGAEETET